MAKLEQKTTDDFEIRLVLFETKLSALVENKRLHVDRLECAYPGTRLHSFFSAASEVFITSKYYKGYDSTSRNMFAQYKTLLDVIKRVHS